MNKQLAEYKKKHGLCNGKLKCDCKKILIKWAKSEIKEFRQFIKMLQNTSDNKSTSIPDL